MNEKFKQKINVIEQNQENSKNEGLNDFVDNYWRSSIIGTAIDRNLSHRENGVFIENRIKEKLLKFEEEFNYNQDKYDLSEIISILDEFPFEFSWTREDLQKKVMLIILKKYENVDNPVEKLRKIKYNPKIFNKLSSNENGHTSPAIQKLINNYTSNIEKDNPELPFTIPPEEKTVKKTNWLSFLRK